MNVDEAVSGNESAGTAAYVDSGTLTISDSTIEVDGAGRYTVAATGTATMVVEDSVIVAGGDAGQERFVCDVTADAFSKLQNCQERELCELRTCYSSRSPQVHGSEEVRVRHRRFCNGVKPSRRASSPAVLRAA